MKLSAGLLSTALSLVWLCTGCSTASLFDSETPTPTNYILVPLPPAAAATPSRASTVDVAIARPDVSPGLDTRRIAVLRGRQLDYYRGTEWGSNVTEVVQTLLVSSLDDQHVFRSVTSEQTRVSSEYLLDVEVRDFQAEYPGATDIPQVRVTMITRLIRVDDREMIATINSSALRSATDNRMSEVAAAFEAASHEVARDLATRAAAAVAADQEKNPGDTARRKD